jgi:hypothetical protein
MGGASLEARLRLLLDAVRPIKKGGRRGIDPERENSAARESGGAIVVWRNGA